ncbi:MAG: hypothetical protein SOZ45_07675 [Ruminococcus sp.]|nr:hypothetical protein [Ruminococcus sp.]
MVIMYDCTLDEFKSKFSKEAKNYKSDKYDICGEIQDDEISLKAVRKIPVSYSTFIKWRFEGTVCQENGTVKVEGAFKPDVLRTLLLIALFIAAAVTLAFYIVTGKSLGIMLPPIIIISALAVLFTMYCVIGKKEKTLLTDFMYDIQQ